VGGRDRWVAPVTLFVAAFLVYVPTLGHELLNWDDIQYVTENPFLGSFSGENLRAIWFTTEMPQYYPMVFTSYLLEGKIHGGNAWGYHLTNNLLHALNSGLVFWWVGLLFGRRSLAWIAGIVFALHPIHVESVAWVTERKDVLSGFFFLASLISYEYWRDGGKRRWYAAALILYVGALFSKTVVCTAALVLVAREVFVGGERSGRRLLLVLPFLLLGGVMAWVTAWVERSMGPLIVAEQLTVGKQILVALSAPFFYVEKLVLPFGLEPVYPFEEAWAWWRPARWVALLIMGVLVFLLFRWADRRRRGSLLFVGVLFLAGILPVLGLVRFHYQRVSFVANHFAYLPSVAFCILVGWLVVEAWECFSVRMERGIIGAGAGAYLVLYAILTWTGCAVWKDSGTLWTRVVDAHPNLAEGHNNLGLWLHRQGRIVEAMREYERAVDLRPAYAEAHNGLALGYLQLGEYLPANEEFRLAVEADPVIAEVYTNWAGLKILMEDYVEAERLLLRALEIAPQDEEARKSLRLLQGRAGGRTGGDPR
jgi:tetratricopeptide (TPR) repeat protein